MDVRQRIEVLDTLAEIDDARTTDGVLGVFSSFIRKLGFERFFVSQLVNPLNPKLHKAMSYSNFPGQIVEYQLEKGHLLRDPVIIYAMRSRRPFSWAEAFKFERRYGNGPVQQIARDFDLNDGIMLPMRRPGSVDGGVSLATNKVDISKDDFAALQLVSMHFYYRLEDMQPPVPVVPDVKLAPRERDVLQYAAVGKTVWEMSVIMSISEAAVKDALVRARRKLNCVNTTQAVSRAIARDLIVP
ncbi:MAG: LuxR family transcriptional regulator [Pseudomonadota bacterium]